ncbi:MAG: non-canonical purine NTP pyrophosphatase [Candidatus Acididesulfobacter guangdongensis]|uniref:Non-canonical purine NTP pyrophosphatase n=1 Tax=Acididesulfobacter guangdongensis TaxID=2597225 RepID=A0A519BGB0_ACIG2|nr:MAG: non-canonical purine NTP pyrophosphatase [Candidatus Acididesulfobacter guangdongensis]
MNILIGTGNKHKFQEISFIMKDCCNVRLIYADDLFGQKNIVEDGLTYKDNALIKAEAYYALLKNNDKSNNNIDYIVSEDTGLEVKCLNNEPGLYTARYSELHDGAATTVPANVNGKDNIADIRINNINKLLNKMKANKKEKDCINGREAKFVCWACLYGVKDGKHNFFYGELNGSITENLSGTAGFGYDPVFYVPEFNKTLAELSEEIKNKISHRANAISKVIDFININNK